MASINNFIASVKTAGMARDNRFEMVITPPSSLMGSSPDSKIVLHCQNVQMPGMNFNTAPVLTYGEQREVVYNRLFEPINVEFILDNTMDVKRFFDEWQALIIDPVSRMVNYYRNYIGTVEIHQLDNTDQERVLYTAKVHEVYPKTVSPISYSATSKDVTKLTVSLQYKYWTPVVGSTEAPTSPDAKLPYNTNGAGVQLAASQITPRGLRNQLKADIPSMGSIQLPS